ncbi:hypothetical protein PVK64_12545 [Aliivibrio sp. S4TY2]|uniref:hypothetical protein n=1 Tax=unclassified Aliivibrio TaxID=2645654 RepID=UPI002378BD38|nr:MULTISPECIES: hypothetical protein [unclassified Aliivibrio]MDD9157006.1 hypothetical protein [Aliivibrio sp. S4TY2]MDD9160780.1 hypothetical protein [Aliivibrio sp. S4TY1]MDD9164809.1 hypothetical protein [Aliivibrio sp. S4MY2]MDD9168916.1 hypothetical protein [Aliivibrio sp. S4MY4]MDD9185444.1 hypothetical protein [Aliivibrio sp. S4MY3]
MFTVLQVKNPVWINEDNTVLNLEVLFEELKDLDFIPHSTQDNADTEHGQTLWKEAMKGSYGEIKPYEPYVKTEEDLAEEARMFFGSEKVVALRIEEDYRLELADISDEQMREVKEYIRAIKPNTVTRRIPNRPEIMNQYSQLNTTLEE